MHYVLALHDGKLQKLPYRNTQKSGGGGRRGGGAGLKTEKGSEGQKLRD